MEKEPVIVLRELAEEIAASYPHLPCLTKDEGSAYAIEFPKTSESGFDVDVYVRDDGYLEITTDHGWHYHGHGLTGEQLEERLGLVRDLLSPAMRIREVRSNNKPYGWVLEGSYGTDWKREGASALVFFNYFGRRSEHVFQNSALPARALRGPHG